MDALKEGNLQLLTDLLNEETADVDVNKVYPEEKFKTLLHVAAAPTDVDTITEDIAVDSIRILLAAGAEVNAVSRASQLTPLLSAAAAKRPRPRVVSALISGGADVNATNAAGRTAVHMVAKRAVIDDDALKCLRALLETKGVDADRGDAKGGQTPLYLAAKEAVEGRNYLPVVRALIAKGADWGLTCGDSKSIKDILKAKVSAEDFSVLADLNESTFTTPASSQVPACELVLLGS